MSATQRQALLEALRARAGLQRPGISQFEDLAVEEASTGRVRFSWAFDEDAHSQYDRTLRFSGLACRDASGLWHIVSMRVDHVGEGSTYVPTEELLPQAAPRDDDARA